MMKYIGLYAIGLIISVFFFREVIVFINTNILDATLVSIQANDYFQLGFRIFLSYSFGAAYFFFKVQRLRIDLTIRQTIFSVIGLMAVLIIIDFIQIFITLKVLSREYLFINRILPLWLTFPGVILYFGILIKYGYKRRDIKWLW